MTLLTTSGFGGQTKKTETCGWNGASGTTYKYWVYPLGTSLKKAPGNYIIVRLENNRWVPIYFGETGDLSERFDGHHKAKCFAKKGATHIHVHTSSDSVKIRQAEEADLLAGYPNALEPYGCNG